VATCFSPASRHSFDMRHYPYYGAWWLVTNPILALRLARLGALRAAREARCT
jgi:hypothetical protein